MLAAAWHTAQDESIKVLGGMGWTAPECTLHKLEAAINFSLDEAHTSANQTVRGHPPDFCCQDAHMYRQQSCSRQLQVHSRCSVHQLGSDE